jgi:glycosyltransferase involved in cell wall biosynthesis
MKTILLLAYDVSPYRGGEAAVAWNYIINMMSSNRIVVIYGEGKTEVEKYLSNNKMPFVSFYNIEAFSYHEKRSILWQYVVPYIRYKQWHRKAYTLAKEIIAKEQIDLIHYLSPIGFKEPGYLWKLNKPYMWGPITAVHNRPLPLYKVLPFSEKITALIRRIVHNAMFRYNPSVVKAIKRCDIIMAATPRTREMLVSIHKKEVFYIPENAIITIENNTPIKKEQNQRLELIWVGRLDYFKALIILLDALCLIEKERMKQLTLHVVGDGYLRAKLEEYTKKYHLEDIIIWHGQVDRKQVQKIFKESHLHIVSSLGEGNPTTIWEAMSKGIPTMTLDHCGMSGVVCEKCGLKIPIKSYEQVIRDIAFNIRDLIENPDKLTKLSQGTIECIQKYTWDKRIEFFNNQYEKAIENYRKRIAINTIL